MRKIYKYKNAKLFASKFLVQFHKMTKKLTQLLGETVLLMGIPLSVSTYQNLHPIGYKGSLSEVSLPNLHHRKEEVIDGLVVNAIVYVESSGDPHAVSSSGARGLMQIKPPTWKEHCHYPVKDAFNPEKNKECGTKYLHWITDYIKQRNPEWGNLSVGEQRNLVFAAYNGGPDLLRRKKWEIERMHPETRNYVKKVNNVVREISDILEEVYRKDI